MSFLMILLRAIHIFSGVYWIGTAFFQISVLTPAAQAAGPDGQKFMQTLNSKTKFSAYMGLTATLTALSGLIMYGIIYGFRLEVLQSPSALVLTLGSLFGLASWAHGSTAIRGTSGKMTKLGAEIAAGGKPPSPAQAAEMQRLSGKLQKSVQISVILSALALLGMSIAQYVS